ncbi:MAG: hypothetical protein WC763_04590 [Candidatus Paceibacterota bacterium]|jgi:hypothetical protein
MRTPQVEVSVCCHASPIEDFKDNPRDHHDPEPIYVCSKCKKECKVEDVCEYCLGAGEVTVDERVYPGEPHMAPIGTEKCQCQLNEETED